MSAATLPAAPPMLETVPMLLGGHWVRPATDAYETVYNPSTGAAIARTPLGAADEVASAVAAAAKRFPRGTTPRWWSGPG